MAKGAFLAVKRGKLGDSVGYTVSNSNNKDKQGWRIYQPVVANPQTDGQIDQRLKLTAVNNLYRALKDVIIRGQENKAYGDESRRAWLSRALGSQSTVPILAKGSTFAPPIKGVPLMYGSLKPLGAVYNVAEEYYVLSSVAATSQIVTVADLSAVLIAAGYQPGDQLTLVTGVLYSEVATPYVEYNTYAVYLDTTDTRTIVDVFGSTIVFLPYDDYLAVDPTAFAAGILPGNTCLAVSISRDGDTQHLRSTSELVMGDALEQYIYGISSAEAETRRATYRKRTTTNTNWQQVPGGEGGGSVDERQQAVTVSGRTVRLSSVSYSDTSPNYLLLHSGSDTYYCKGKLAAGTAIYVCQDASAQQAPQDATNDNTINAVGSDNLALGLRDWLMARGVSGSYLVP